jgi:hypothetical protein
VEVGLAMLPSTMVIVEDAAISEEKQAVPNYKYILDRMLKVQPDMGVPSTEISCRTGTVAE